MKLNYKKLSYYFLFLIMGMSLIMFGIINIAEERFNKELSDSEIVERAKDLGMIEIKDIIFDDN
ncbi:hypothetical protein QUF55_07360 [Clostridiaceae bacterium HSG29]|nr:hypothetical protein [Clostridiaceae bacterium HSG29]